MTDQPHAPKMAVPGGHAANPLAPKEPSQMFTQDLHNNIGRHCTIDAATGRVWRVQTAVTGSHYLVRSYVTGEHRVVTHRQMTNLY